MYRIRALSHYEEKNNWTPLNPLFKQYISSIENVASNKLNIDTYVVRDNNFELEYTKKICLISKRKSHAISTISGQVGKGKTTFIQYIRKNIIHKSSEFKNIVTIYVNLTQLSQDYNEQFESRLKLTLESKIQNLLNISSYELMVKYLNFYGFDISKINSITNEYKEHYSSYNLLDFFDHITNGIFKKIIIFFDDIDENKREAVSSIKYKIYKLHSFLYNSNLTMRSLIIVPLRDYNKGNFSDTNQIPDTLLPAVSGTEVAKSKLIEIKESIIDDMADNYKQEISNKTNDRILTITKPTIIKFLSDIIDILFKGNKPVINYLVSLSAGNLKHLSSNILNVLQSKNLPLSDIVDYAFNPNSTIKKQELILSKNELIQLLMAVRFPYFDVEISKILNVYNVNNSFSRFDYYNVLLIPRILFYIYNHKHFDIPLIKIRKNLTKYGYHNNSISTAFDKCFKKGLFKTDLGSNISQIDCEKDFIKLSESGELYISDLIYQFSYLQYVCEDTPVSPNLYVPISIKYSNDKLSYSHINYKKNRILSVQNFVKFISKMEKFELKKIKNMNLDINHFLLNFSFRDNGIGVKLSSILEKKVYNEIYKINN